MAQKEPLGFHVPSVEGCPSGSTYWVAICPLEARVRNTASGATKRPSPWEIGTQWISPGSQPASHGDLTDVTRVYTMRLM